MSTVPGPDTPAPSDNHMVHTVSDPKSHDYGRLSAGGNATGDASEAPPGPTPGYSISMTGNPPTNAGPDFGHGATQILTGTSGADMDNDNDTA